MFLKQKFNKSIVLFLTLVLILSSISLTACQQQVQQPSVSEQGENTENSTTTGEYQNTPLIQLTDEEKDLSVRDAKGFNGSVASASSLASKIGLETLKNNGNAIDAAVATAFALGLVEPNASGPGGCGFMLINFEDTNDQEFLDYRSMAPEVMTQEYFETLDKKTQRSTGMGTLVPGFVAGMLKAHELYGSLPLEELLQPTIDLAENGFEVAPFLGSVFADNYEKLMKYDNTAELFLNDGFPYVKGDTFINKEYASLLKKILADGKDGFYKGEVAEDLVRSVQEAGGVITLDDLANYEVDVREPLEADYRGYTVVTAPPTSCGAGILEALNIAENFDVKQMGQNTAETLHMWSEIFKMMNIDRYTYVGDTDFVSMDPIEALISQDFADERVNDMSMDSVAERQDAADIEDYNSHTTHVSIVDKDGNMVSMTNTLGLYFGCSVAVENRGFVMNSQTFNFSKTYKANSAEPFKKVRSTMSPTIIFNSEGDAIATLGTPGGSRILTTITQIVSNIIDFDMDMQSAINAPRIYQNYKGSLYVEGHMDPDVVTKLEEKGHKVELKGEYDYYFGGAQGILRNAETKELHGGADTRRDGKALAY